MAEGEELEVPEATEPADEEQGERELQEELDQVRRQAEEYLALSQRLKADFENFRLRTQRQMAQAQEEGAARVLEGLLPILDAMDKAMEMSENDESNPYRQGLSLIQRQLKELLQREGVEEVGAPGDLFDPTLHEALLHVPGEEPGHIAAVVRKGYRLGARLLRPAQVTVGQETLSEGE
ncbi:MAG: nucleotide exchange factor GrpE [Bacillota bacterium]|nr:nucleotide exchange factor GrpE [Bacillota bacterium]